jgi:acetoin utilization deacetylase AcuC-like enzyme
VQVIYNPSHNLHNPPYEHYDGVRAPYAETAARAEAIRSRLASDPGYEIRGPERFSAQHIRSIHHPAYVRFLRERSAGLKGGEVLYPSYHITDTYAPVTAQTYKAAAQAVDVALTAAQAILQGEPHAYGLCRPPGHHAEHVSMGGYCYFNNAAIAANYLARHGRVAILDIDFHHGNGTQNIFYDRSDVLYVSLHADPAVRYPYISGFTDEHGRGEGEGFTKNYPLPLGTNDTDYLRALRGPLQDITDFAPDFLLVSAGFDTYEHDPIGGFALTAPCYGQIGQAIASLGQPTVVLQEGGYNVEALGDIAHTFLEGFKNTHMLRT